MMKVKKNLLPILAGSLLLAGWGAGMTGCVDEEPSILLNGNVVYEGEIVEVELPTGEVEERLICDMTSASVGSVDLYFRYADLNLAYGQQLEFTAEILNQLTPSNQKSGTEETFPGLYQDQNAIQITGASIHFPDSSLAEKYLAKPSVRFTALIESGGGGALATFPIFRAREFGAVEQFYNEAAAQAGVDASAGDVIIPVIAEIKLEGKTLGGQEVESNTFAYPINICNSKKNCELGSTPLCMPKK